MNPLEAYITLIHYWQQNPCKVKGEVHHIIPQSLGGPDLDWNKVKMPTLDHIEAHRLLMDLYPTGKEHKAMCAAYALVKLSRKGIKLTDEEAAEARDAASEAKKGCPAPPGAWKPGHTPWNKGKKGLQHHDEEWKRHNSEVLTGRKRSDETRRRISEALKGKPKSTEAKKHMSENHAPMEGRKDPVTGRFIKASNS